MKNSDFNILPWEYRGASVVVKPEAQATFEVAGHTALFHLKMHDGLIYFKDPKRAPVFAVTHQFERELYDEELIGAWQSGVEKQNYGRVFWRQLWFSDISTNTVVVAINRPDYSGWISDAFHIDWRETPKHRTGRSLDMWKGNIGDATWRAIERVRNSLLDRAMSESERCNIEPHWHMGSEDELRRLFAVVMQLYVRRHSGSDTTRTWRFGATNPASEGGFKDGFSSNYHADLKFSRALPHLSRLIEQHFVFVGMKWENYKIWPSNDGPFRAMATRWGRDWRGHASFDMPEVKLVAPLRHSLSQHERLELLLELREWLEGKVTARQSSNWLAQALE